MTRRLIFYVCLSALLWRVSYWVGVVQTRDLIWYDLVMISAWLGASVSTVLVVVTLFDVLKLNH